MILFLSLGVASSNCLQGAIPLERRSNLTNAATSSNYALGIFVNKWAAGYLTSAVVQIIIQEVLGLHARVSGKGGSTVDAFYALAGCEHPTATGDDRGCDVNLVTSHHINVEGWTESYQPTWDRVQQGYAPVAPINLGNMGYFGKTSMYLSSKVVQTAWEAEGLNLEFYRGYNVSWHNAAKYFLPPASMNVSRLKRCNETRLMESEAMEIYLNLTGDTDGIEITEDGKVTGRCWNGYFWYPPSCRADPSKCLTFLTAGTGWNLEETMQKSTGWNMQVATAVASTWSDFTHLPHQGDLMFYWWVPDPTFLDLNPVDIAFPTFDRAAHSRGDKRTAPSSISIDKYVSKDLSVLAPEVVEMLNEFRIEMQQVNDMLRDQLQTEDSDFEVACRWLKANQDTWKNWLPDATKCYAGFGLYHEATGKYVQNRLDSSGLNCKACASGTHSSRLIDEGGSTYVCIPCAPGTAQPSGAALSCDPCAAGEHQDEEGQSICKRCGISMYQDARGEKDCKACPEGTTTPGLSSSRVEDCGCERGSMNVAGNGHGSNVTCSACGEGLVCPFAATLEGLKTGTVTESHYQIPSIAPGYYSTAEQPMDLFKCPSTDRCPGGRPGECAPGLQGVPCTQCADGQSWDGATCVDCHSWIVFLWFCAGLSVLLILPMSYYINKRTVPRRKVER